MKLKVTKVYNDIDKAFKSNYRNILLQGGTRSSKTFSMCQYLITLALKSKEHLKIDIIRKTFPALRATVMKDFFEILHGLELYNKDDHHQTTNTYTLNNTVFEFYSVDDPQKIRGRKRDYVFLNESNEIDYDDFIQLNLRTTRGLFYDFNPSDIDSWLYTDLSKRNDSIVLKSTYKDNQFLSTEQVFEIERLQQTDIGYWETYGLGEYSVSKAKIYSHYTTYKVLPENIKDITYGLDFGWNHPMSLTKVHWTTNNEAFVQQLVYESNLTTSDLINRLKTLSISGEHTIYCDSANPDKIEEIKRAGFKTEKANKEVKGGIDKVKSTPLYICETSTDVLNEIKKYRWKTDANSKLLDEPVKLWDDAMDSMRYAIMGKQGIQKYSGEYLIL